MRRISVGSPIRGAVIATALAITATAATTLAFPGAAHAAADHAISGETWSSSTEWYNSTTVRTKAGTGTVTVKLSKTPFWYNNNGGVSQYDTMKWQLVTPSGSVISGSYTTGIQRNVTTQIKYLTNGTQFRNAFARSTTCFQKCSHTFEGTENY